MHIPRRHGYSGRGAACPHPGWRGDVGGSWSWRKSRASGGGDGECVEVSWTGESVLVRNSRSPQSAVVAFAPDAWVEFVRSVTRSAPSPSEPEARP
ncbi:DUF397 domain-containing protein [Streptomyces sp. NPDC058469]|uniref:DUF397 domain-containing protein n=1 Tax=Streptomyces sp. NPDC058469 TaxID=3346514 RepID=UPI00364E3BEC